MQMLFILKVYLAKQNIFIFSNFRYFLQVKYKWITFVSLTCHSLGLKNPKE